MRLDEAWKGQDFSLDRKEEFRERMGDQWDKRGRQIKLAMIMIILLIN
jgi:predicted SpoU family rRNA methylase